MTILKGKEMIECIRRLLIFTHVPPGGILDELSSALFASLSLSFTHSLSHSLYVSSVAFICCRGECWMCGCVFASLHFVVVIVVVVVEINTNALWWIITVCSFICFCFHFIVVVVVVFILSFLLFVVLIEKDFKSKENKRKC